MSLRSQYVLLVANRTLRRANRERRRRLEAELAAYSTPAALADLSAILRRDPGHAQEVWQILDQQAAARSQSRRCGGMTPPPAWR